MASKFQAEENPLLNGPILNDPIHGVIELPPLCVKIIDTPEFQRLRFIKQLGGGYFVYPGAAHNRFEHSIGVCYLAGELLKAIQRRQPELGVTQREILCVQIAGLCHDMGHGPFSHLFDRTIIRALIPETKWKHEQGSVDMLKYMLEKKCFTNDLTEDEKTFIRELVLGKVDKGQAYADWLKTVSKGQSKKSFLYEIVNNKRNEIDVDKWDYFARDCHMLGIKNNFEHKRCIALARVMKADDDQWQICYRDKEYNNLLEMFQTRYQLHRRAYQHKTVKAVEMMISEALVAANEYIKFRTENDGLKTMSEAIYCMPAFTNMTDEVFYRILNDDTLDTEQLEKARHLLTRVLKRDIYLLVDQKPYDEEEADLDKELEDKIQKEIWDIMKNMKPDLKEHKDALQGGKGIFEIMVVELDYGKGNKNPIEGVMFYGKRENNEPSKPFSIKEKGVTLLLPRKWAEKLVRIYTKKAEDRIFVKQAWSKWINDKESRKSKKPKKQ